MAILIRTGPQGLGIALKPDVIARCQLSNFLFCPDGIYSDMISGNFPAALPYRESG